MGKKKNSFLKKLVLIMIFVFVVALGIVSCTFLENKTLSVPKSVIQGKIDKKFPITKNFLFAKVTLKNPKVDFKGDKMYIDADYSASLVGNGISGKMYLSTNVRYDVNKEELYLVDLSIDKILDENGKEVADSSEAKMLKSLLSNYIETTPVYKYGEEYEKKNKNGDKKHIKIKNMYIRDGKLFVQT